MGIKYVCDYCGQEANEHKIVTDDGSKEGLYLCKNCENHLLKQTWRMSEETIEFEKRMKAVTKYDEELRNKEYDYIKQIMTNEELVKKYKYALIAIVNSYNESMEMLDKFFPNNILFFKKQKKFEKIDAEWLIKEKGREAAETISIRMLYDTANFCKHHEHESNEFFLNRNLYSS